MRRILFILLASMLSVGAMDADAQSFLKKIKKAVKTEVENQSKKTKKQFKKSNNISATQSNSSQATSQSKGKISTKTARVDIGQIAPIIEYGPLSGQVNGHKWVDMGLPSGTRWATCNVGATAPEQPGKHYSWGETTTKATYTQANTKTYGKDVADFSSNKTQDVATLKWGKGWRMPTQEEFSELVHYCHWKYVKKGGRWGAEITSPVTKNSIFLPATGAKDGSKVIEASGCGMYWTSTPHKDSYNNGAHDYHFGGALGEMGIAERYYGQAVRPVTDYNVNTEIPSNGEINGHKWVDLGLPSGLKWATCNVGTDVVDQSGNHYKWGETSTFQDKGSKKNELYGTEVTTEISGNPQYDAARAEWGGTWRIPTLAEFNELIENCTWEWTSIGRRKGVKVTSKHNGNYIFLPAAGICNNYTYTYGRADDINESAMYWTSTPSQAHPSHYTFRLSITNIAFTTSSSRTEGLSIRPVSD